MNHTVKMLVIQEALIFGVFYTFRLVGKDEFVKELNILASLLVMMLCFLHLAFLVKLRLAFTSNF